MIYISLPVLNESENIPALLECLRNQDRNDFELVVCVNNYDDWWNDDIKKLQCIDNQKSTAVLKAEKLLKVVVIDRSSQTKGWRPKKGGVGHARKTAMDYISSMAEKDDLIISIDADTFYPSDYLKNVTKALDNKSVIGLAVPYYHKTDGKNDRLILRYEIYMRYYLLNMLRIKNPYAYTALGSAMAFPVWAYRKLGGLTPVMSGEDFYFLQKLVKNGKLEIWSDTIAFPSARFSDRVNFGTGPALIKGQTGDWDSYPIYDYKLFDVVKETYDKFPTLFKGDLQTPMDDFLQTQFKTKDLWGPLRKNYKDEKNFIKACISKVDGLRILQFLKISSQESHHNNSKMLVEYIKKYMHKSTDNELINVLSDFSFENSTVEQLSVVRDFLFNEEMKLRVYIS